MPLGGSLVAAGNALGIATTFLVPVGAVAGILISQGVKNVLKVISKTWVVEDESVIVRIDHNLLTGQKKIFLNDTIVKEVGPMFVEGASEVKFSTKKGDYLLRIRPNQLFELHKEAGGFCYDLHCSGMKEEVL